MSFAINTPAPSGPAEPGAPVRATGDVLVGVSGGARQPGLRTSRVVADAGVDLRLLTQLGGKLLEPIIQREQEAAFMDGMSRASQGEAAADIQAKRPAWAQLFGDSTAVMGARAFEKVSDAQDLNTAVMSELEQDAELSPDAFKQKLFQRVQARKTGDPVRDTVLLQSALQFMPDAMRMHAKAHAAHTQREATAALVQTTQGAMRAFGETLTTINSDPALQDEDAAGNALQRVVETLTPLPGVNYETQVAAFTQSLDTEVQRGNLHVLAALKKEGVFAALPDAAQERILRAEREVSNRVIADRAVQYAPDAIDDLIELRAGRKVRGEDLFTTVKKINARVESATGITAIPLISASAAVDMAIGHERDAVRKAELEAERARLKAEREAERNKDRAHALFLKQAEANHERSIVARLFTENQDQGMVYRAANSYGVKPAVLAQEFNVRFATADTAGKAKLITQAGEGIDNVLPAVAQRIRNAATANSWTADHEALIPVLEQVTSPEARGAIFKGSSGRRLQFFQEELARGATDVSGKAATMADLWERAVRRDLTTPRKGVSQKEIAEAEEILQDSGPKWFGDTVEIGMPAARAALSRSLADLDHVAGEEKYAEALAVAKSQGLQVYGGVAVVQQNPNDPPWELKALDGGGLNRQEADLYFRQEVDLLLARHKIDPATATVIRRANQDGQAWFSIISNERRTPLYFSTSDILKHRVVPESELPPGATAPLVAP